MVKRELETPTNAAVSVQLPVVFGSAWDGTQGFPPVRQVLYH